MSEHESSLRRQRAHQTREQLLDAAEQLFGEQGYHHTSIEAVVLTAGLTRGALYHHFEHKLALFAAVCERLEQFEPIVTGSGELRQQIQQTIARFFERCHDPRFRQIVLIDSPAILGQERWHRAELRRGGSQMTHHIAQLIGAEEPAVPLIADMLIGAIVEAAKRLAVSTHPEYDAAIATELLQQQVEWIAQRWRKAAEPHEKTRP